MNTNAVLQTIASRFSCRAYTDQIVDPADIDAIVQAGLEAPSAMNLQPWRIAVMTDPADLKALNDAGLAQLEVSNPTGYQRMMDRGGTLIYNAPAVIIVSVEDDDKAFSPLLDAGIVVSQLALAATSLGLNSCIAAFPGLGFQGEAGVQLATRYIPQGCRFAISLIIGHGQVANGQPHAIDRSRLVVTTEN
ncbi:MAG: nitroreductase family protein [Propionibacteriaceae bacterium]|jgi:nitroreductase|nr:nitroreductase family protein [Propionibacteriaceae bacterium]